MGDGFELVIWGVFIAIIWLRGLAKQAKKARLRETLEDDDIPEDFGAGSPAAKVSSAQAIVRAPQANVRAPRATAKVSPGKPRPSLREQWAEMARQIERQVEVQRDAGQSMLVEREDDDEATVFIPGRRVIPAPGPDAFESSASSALAPRSRSELAQDRDTVALARRSRETSVERSGSGRRREHQTRSTVHPAVKPSTGRGQDSKGLMGRLSRYTPLQQAVILSELLGPPLSTKDDHESRKGDVFSSGS